MPNGISVKITGTKEAIAALDKLMAYMHGAAQDAVEQCAEETGTEAKHIMGPRHPRGTPGAPADAPPWRISGALSLSIKATRAYLAGPDAYAAYVGPTNPPVYGRVQELGRTGSRWPNTHVNPHPYLKPARDNLLHAGVYAAIFYETAASAEHDALH